MRFPTEPYGANLLDTSLTGSLITDYVRRREAKKVARRIKHPTRYKHPLDVSPEELSAIAKVVPDGESNGWVSLCITNDGHMRAVYSRWFGGVIKGTAKMVSMGATAERTIPVAPIRNLLLDAQADASVEAWL